MSFFHPVVSFYHRFERRISSLFLVFGFIFDAFTLKRVDALFENLFIFGYLLIIGVCIILIHLKDTENASEKKTTSAHFWYVNILQFAFGGIFSAYLILYFRSADIFVAWPFIAILALTFIANEFLKKHYIRLSFQISLYFLSIYSFAIFLVPVVLRQIGTSVFILSGIISLIAISIFIKILFYFTKEKFVKSKKLVIFLISSIVILVNSLYFFNLIPPIPLSLKDAGAFYSIQKNSEGNYSVTYEKHGWRDYFDLYPDFKKTSDQPVYAFSAIFSPKGLNLAIVHEWQHYDENKEEWKTNNIINLSVIGGRDGGFRTYSARSSLLPGKWRVNIKTEQGQIIGRLRFNVVHVETTPELQTMVK